MGQLGVADGAGESGRERLEACFRRLLDPARPAAALRDIVLAHAR